MTRFNEFLEEKAPTSSADKKEGSNGVEIPRNEKGEPDHTGTGIKPEDSWKTPEQLEQDQIQAEISQKDQEEQYIEQKVKELQDRKDIIHSKLGRILATPKELEELDKEREEEEEFEKLKAKLQHEKEKEGIGEDELEEAVKQKSPPKKVVKKPPKKVVGKTTDTKSTVHKELVAQIQKKGFEHTAKGVWTNKSGKRGRITPDNKWELIDDEDVTEKGKKGQKVAKDNKKENSSVTKKTGVRAALQKKQVSKTPKTELNKIAQKISDKLSTTDKEQKLKKMKDEIKALSGKGKGGAGKYSTSIAGKNKELDQKIITEKQKAFVDTLYDFKKGDKAFLQKNKKYQSGKKSIDLSLDKEYFVPKSVKQLIASGKVPQREIQILLRMLNSQQASATQPPISYFTDGGPGGAGKLQAQCGELMTLCCTAMTKEQKEDFRQSIYKHIENNDSKKMICTKDWADAAINNSDAIHARVSSEFKVADATKLITHVCWDVAYDVEALGMNDYKKNKGYSTDIFLKLKLPNGQKILNEVSLKKDKNVNFLNSSTGKFETWDKRLSEDLKPSVYQKNLMKVLSRNKINDKELNQLISNKKMLSNKKSKAHELKQIMEQLNIKSLNEVEGNNRAERKLLFLAIEAKAESNPNSSATKEVEKIQKLSTDYATRATLAVRDNPALAKGMISSIREEFPLRAVCENEETMSIGKASVDKKVMDYIFKTSDWNEIQSHLETITDADPPYLAYRVGKKGGRLIPVAILKIREDGVGYGGQFKFELKLHGKFYTELKDANKNLYGTQFPTKTQKESMESITFNSMLLEYMEEYEYDDLDLDDDLEERVYDDLEERVSKLKTHFETHELVEDD